MSGENKTRDTVDAVTGLVKAVPIYQDAIQPAAKEIGVGLQKTVQLALAPISGLVWGFDKIKHFVETSVAKKLEKVPENQIKTPLPQIAGPALEALKYTGHDEELREMFANLLATSMDEESAKFAHPSFVEIIRQLSSDEAKICRYLKKHKNACLVNIQEIDKKQKHFRIVVRNFSNLGQDSACQFPMMIQSYLQNLNRLGIIQFDFEGEPLERKPFEELKNHPEIQRILKTIQEDKHEAQIDEGTIILTAFGRMFITACVE
jgi:hypothetical protein